MSESLLGEWIHIFNKRSKRRLFEEGKIFGALDQPL
jgi:hypothetical protein